MTSNNEISSFIWNVCDDVLRGLFKPHEYGDIILPFTVLRRLDCVIEDRKDEIISLYEEYKTKVDDPSPVIMGKIRTSFFNYSRFDLNRLRPESVPTIRPFLWLVFMGMGMGAVFIFTRVQ